MPDEKSAALTMDTPPGDVAPEDAAAAVEDAQESVDGLRERIADLEKRLTKEGRSKASIKAQTDELQTKLDDAIKANQEWKDWYLKNAATPEEKAAATREAAAAREQGDTKAARERDHWRAIAEEENPVIKKALTRAAGKGEFMTKGQIEALRESLGETEDETPPGKKTPPRVSGGRATGNQEPTLDDQISAALKNKDFTAALRLKTQKASLAGQ